MRYLIALVLILALGGQAQAAFLIPAVVTALGFTGVAATVAQVGLTLAVSFGLSYVAGKLMSTPEAAMDPLQPGGAKLDLRADVDVPRSFIVGRAVTAGSLAYASTYGERGEIDNSDLIQIIALADTRSLGLVDVYVEDKKAELTEHANPDVGYSVDGYGNSVFLRFFDGTQTEADPLTVANLSDHSNRPWTSAMVGNNVTYVRIWQKYHQRHSPGPLQYRFIVDGALLYDPRKDTTVGGSGAHRWGDESTYEWTENAAVIIYNVVRGIHVDGDLFYGLNAAADQCPLDVWFAAMNACNNRYHAGGEITVDTEPRDTIKELLKCCGGRFTEIGGVYKLYVDAPELPVFEFTDADLMVAREEDFKPILGLEQRVNYLTGKYMSPANWLPKVAAPYTRPEWEAEDGRRKTADLDAPMVHDKIQMQRLMRQLAERNRRERKHRLTLPPRFMAVEPGDIGAWTSERNGYAGKLFEVDDVDYEANCCVTLSLTEIDPADYDWEEEFELPEFDGVLVPIVPAPKAAPDFALAGYIDQGDDGAMRPAIRITWDAPADGDIERLFWQLRRPSELANLQSGSTSDVVAGVEIIRTGLLPETAYEVRARWNSHSGYDAEWSEWQEVSTPGARLQPVDFSESLRHLLLTYRNQVEQEIRRTNGMLSALVAEIDAKGELDKATLRRELVRSAGQVMASFSETITLALGPESAIAQSIAQLQASVAGVESNLKARFIVGVTPEGALAAYELEATAEAARSGFKIIAQDDGAGGTLGQVWFEADRFYVGKTDEAEFVPMFVIDNSTAPAKIVWNGDLIAAGAIKAFHLDVATLSSISANIGTMTAGLLRSNDSKMIVDLTNGRIEVHD